MHKILTSFSVFVSDFSDHEKDSNQKIRKYFMSSPPNFEMARSDKFGGKIPKIKNLQDQTVLGRLRNKAMIVPKPRKSE